MMKDSIEFVSLNGGPTVPAEVICCAVALEFRGLRLYADGPTLRVAEDKSGDKRGQLTDDDRQIIRKWKTHLLAVVTYEPPQASVVESGTMKP